jgi:hypothetical protein
VGDLTSLILLLLRKSPLLLVLLAGLIMMFVRWKRHPRASLLGAIATALYILEILVFSFIYLPSMFMRFGSRDWIYTFIQIADDLVYAGILILLVSAAFSDRKPKTTITF